MGLCLWIRRDSKFLGQLYYRTYIPIIVKSGICTLELRERLWSLTSLTWLGNGDVRPRTNSCMLRDPDVKSVTGQANVARRATRATILIYYTGSQSTREVVFVTKQGSYALSIA